MTERKYRLSVWGDMYSDAGPYVAIDKLIENGYGAMEFSTGFSRKYLKLPREEFLAEGKKIHDYAAERNFEISQGHILFKHDFIGDEAFRIMKDNIDFLYAVGVKNMVLHIIGCKDGEKRKKNKRKRYPAQLSRLKELIAYIGDRDIVLCIENTLRNSNTEKVEYLLEFIHDCDNSPHLGICLDTGHLNRSNGLGHVKQTFKEFFENSEGRIKALHVNGNAGSDDQHLFPFTGKEGLRPDWLDFINALNNSDYDGLYNYEIPGEKKGVPIAVLDMKLRYGKELFEYMTGGAFQKDAE